VGAEQSRTVRPRDGRYAVKKRTPAQRQRRGAAVKRSTAVKKSSEYNAARPVRPMKQLAARSQPISGGARSSVIRSSSRTASAKVSSTSLFGSRTSSVRAAGRSLPTLPSSNPLPHRGPYAAVLGGAANTRTATTGAITGSSMSRKP
jgi:hypothetical protein